ncbi:transcription factor Sox-3 [Anopheles sinensis]|uniref:Transcription factor Sox-3 n=1 Tax=Anopheles sinensis TaxID=74873 RepID=A0A084VHD2_ANOSI|nr:transcription factor Sox-3 [Anopheles sinensis]
MDHLTSSPAPYEKRKSDATGRRSYGFVHYTLRAHLRKSGSGTGQLVTGAFWGGATERDRQKSFHNSFTVWSRLFG